MNRLASIAAFAAALVGPAVARADEPQPWVGVSIEELYDSNVLNGAGPDAITRVSPRAGLFWDGHRGKLVADYMAALHAYALETTDNTVNHKAELRGKYLASRRLELTVDTELVVADDYILLTRGNLAPNVEGGLVDFSWNSGAAYRATRRFSILGSYEGRLSRFELENGTTFVDGDEHRVDGGIGWRFTRRVEGTLRGRWQGFVSYTDGGTIMSNAVGGTAGLSWRLSRLWRFTASAGPMALFTADNPTPMVMTTGTTDVSVVGSARLLRVGERSRYSISAGRDLYGATGAPEAMWSDGARTDFVWKATRRMRVRLGAGVYRTEGDSDLLTDARTIGFSGRGEIGWMSRKGGWRVDLYAEHREQNGQGGNTPFGDLQRTQVGLRLSALVGGSFMDIDRD